MAGHGPEQDKDLQWIAREGLKAPLPEHWKPCKTTDTDEIYYFNFSSGESTWDHPCDEYYRTLYEVPPRRPPSSLLSRRGRATQEQRKKKANDAFIHAGAAQEEGQRPQKFVDRGKQKEKEDVRKLLDKKPKKAKKKKPSLEKNRSAR